MSGKELAVNRQSMKVLSCKESVKLILRKEEGKLSLMERISLWRHLTVCSLCRIFSVQNDLINRGMQHKHGKQLSLSNHEKDDIIRNVLDERKE